MLVTLPKQIDTLVAATVTDMSKYAWIYAVGIGSERPFIFIPYEVFATTTGRIYSTAPGGDAVNFQMAMSYNSDTSITYRTSAQVNGMQLYGVGSR